MRSIRVLGALLLALWSAPLHALVLTPIGEAQCASGTTCTVNATGTVPIGGTIVIYAIIGSKTPANLVVSDNAAVSNCGGAYPAQFIGYGTAAAVVEAHCTVTSGAIGSGTTCGANGAAQCTFTLSYSGGANPIMLAAFAATGNAQTASFYAGQGTQVSGTWTSGTPVSGSTTNALQWSSEDAVSVIATNGVTATNQVGTFTGGFTPIAAYATTASGPSLWIVKQTMTNGTAQLGFTPTNGSAKAFLNASFMYVNATAIGTLCVRALVGVGC